MALPTVRDLMYNQSLRERYRICPTCHGGRGAVTPVVDEAHPSYGNDNFTVVPCPTCLGRKVLER